MKKIRWGIIGCGDVTERKSGPAFSKVADYELVAVMRRSAEGAEDYAARHKVPRWYINAEYYLIEQVVQTLLGKGSCVSMGASAADTNRVMEMILGRK